ncbi:TetR family transcriptional regulator [Actinocorallia longicatena]|uniref:TetR family transcriptional regulator n=2 Tax=Actinocorallia longicatena TaxID=111803 RepID=A0ABP6QKW2_9ACTN
MSAEERRESVILAAMSEFARGGYQGTSTEAIAKRVGVSQPYLFRLFPNKRAIFLAACLRCMEATKSTFVEAAKDLPVDERHHAMATSYLERIVNTELLMMQMQMHVAVFVAKENGDAEFGAILRRAWTDLYDTCRELLGFDNKATTDFFSCGMLINVMTALDYPEDDPLWGCIELPTGEKH